MYGKQDEYKLVTRDCLLKLVETGGDDTRSEGTFRQPLLFSSTIPKNGGPYLI